MGTRRNFIQKALGAGVSIPFLSFSKVSAAKINESKAATIPILMCSRGESWGKKVLTPAWESLTNNGNLLDAIEKGANVVELDPEDTSVGYGGLPNEDGVVQLDASIMYGPTHNCGSVAAIEGIKTPSSVARLVMERSDHIHIVGEGAAKFARAHGFKQEDLLTERARKIWLRWKENLSEKDDWFPPEDGDYDLERSTGTINVLGVDKEGNVAGITTTSGLFGKISGRIGDSPIIGAGLYVDNAVGAAGATGRGEEVIRICGSYYVVQKMAEGLSPQEACEAACKKIIDVNGGPKNVDFNDKFVAVNKNGEVGCAQVRGSKERTLKATFYSTKGLKVVEGPSLIETD